MSKVNEEFIRAKIEKKLLDDENIVWCGSTAKGATPQERNQSIVTIFVAAFWLFVTGSIFSSAMPVYIEKTKDNPALWIVIAIFIFVTFYFPAEILYNYFVGKFRYYVLTNKRIYIIRKNGFIKLSRSLKYCFKVLYVSGTGSIGTVKFVFNTSGNNNAVCFSGIENADEVHSLAEGVLAEGNAYYDNRANFNL